MDRSCVAFFVPISKVASVLERLLSVASFMIGWLCLLFAIYRVNVTAAIATVGVSLMAAPLLPAAAAILKAWLVSRASANSQKRGKR